jgi:hypothetical protein
MHTGNLALSATAGKILLLNTTTIGYRQLPYRSNNN